MFLYVNGLLRADGWRWCQSRDLRDRMMSILSGDTRCRGTCSVDVCDGLAFAMSDCLLTISDRGSSDISLFLEVFHVSLVLLA